MKKFIILLTIAFLSSSCAHYNSSTIEALYEKNHDASDITEELCEDFLKGAEAFRNGPDKAWPFLGKAREIDETHIFMKRQGMACYEVESMDLEDSLKAKPLEDFRNTWRDAWGVVK